MSPLELLSGLAGAFRERGRTALTLSGIVIGSFAVVALAALLAGGKAALVHTNQRLTGTDLIEIDRRDPPLRERHRSPRGLDRADAAALEASWAVRGRSVAAEASRQLEASSAARNKTVRFTSASPDTLALYRLELARGRFLTPDDLDARRRVCVVGQEVYRELLQHRPLGDALRLTADGVAWTVVGVLADKPVLGSTTSTNVWDRKVLVPETTFDALYSPRHEVQRLVVRAEPDAAGNEHAVAPLSTVRAAIEQTLLRRHGGVRAFALDDPSRRAQERLILAIIELLLLGTATLALVTGGINVANVMLVRVAERTREIGLRRALGASRGVILGQFLVESAALSALGGLIGVGSGALLAVGVGTLLGSSLGHFAVRVEPWSVAAGLALALVTGIGAGLAPALRASRLDVVAALRSE